jgi:hypothetical protein
MSLDLSRNLDWIRSILESLHVPGWNAIRTWSPLPIDRHWPQKSYLQWISTISLIAITPTITSLIYTFIRNVRRSQRIGFLRESTDQLDPIPGPPASWWQLYIGGHYQAIFKYPSIVHWHIENLTRYGLVYRTCDTLGQTNVVMSDPKGLHYILSANSYQFVKIERAKRALIHVAGEKGMLVLGVRFPNELRI